MDGSRVNAVKSNGWTWSWGFGQMVEVICTGI